jgi:hypothetical protein
MTSPTRWTRPFFSLIRFTLIAMKLMQTWFSYRGQMRLLDFITHGFAPGILLGVGAMMLDNFLDTQGKIIFPYLVFSIWPASAMLVKLANSWQQKT